MTDHRQQTVSISSYLAHLRAGRLTKDELDSLCATIQRGDCINATPLDRRCGMLALHRVVEANLPLVVKLAKRYWFEGVFLDDLVQAGNVGLLQAAQTFDPGRGAAFSTWAAYSIKSSLLDFLAENQHATRVPRQVHDRVMGERRNGEAGSGDSAGRRAVRRSISIDAENSSGFQVVERLQGRVNVCEVSETLELRRIILELVGKLSEPRRIVVVERYGLDGSAPIGTVKQAERHGITREAIRQRHRSALLELAGLAEDLDLKVWLDEP